MRKFFIILSIFLNVNFIFLTPVFSLDFFDEKDSSLLAKELLDSFSKEEKIGQLFLITYPGNKMTPALKEWILDKHLGGIKIFGWNASDISALMETIAEAKDLTSQAPYSIPLFISTDQEGGWVQHIRHRVSSSLGNLGLSATNSPWEAYEVALATGKELSLLGINMNFAPTVDLYTNYKNLVIGPRSFSADAKKTALFALAYYKGLKDANIIATAKHFPGHGEATEDSHGVLPTVNLNKKDLYERELVPYIVLIGEGLPAIMGGHLLFPLISDAPSSLSSTFLKDILVNELGFQGIVVTDDLIMGGATSHSNSSALTAENALRSGNTLLLGSMNFSTLERIRQHLLSLMENDFSFESIINEAVYRNLKVKLEYLKEKTLYSDLSVKERLDLLPLVSTQEVFQQSAIKSVTLINKENISLDREKRTLLISTYLDFFNVSKEFFSNSYSLRYSYLPLETPSQETIREIKRLAPLYDQIIFNSTTPASYYYLEVLKPWADKVTLVSSLYPTFLDKVKWVDRSLIVYGITDVAYRAGFWALLGFFNPEGQFPLEINISRE